MPEKVILITGFEPFGKREINASWEAVRLLPDTLGARRIEKRRLPVVFGLAAETAIAAAEALRAEALLCVGEAAGRKAVTPEMAALNLRYASIPDNAGHIPRDTPVLPGGENALFSTLPVREMVSRIQAEGLPAAVSYSAGVYVCNDLFYLTLHRFGAAPLPCGFVHVPLESELPSAEAARALCAAISCL